ncbi:hypothetical protein EVAR_47262_1 [Eumeta japonica]|uniref:Uncharacterized protein n=1 Tax=Eumeta variegata TaxID=151549 RepID=A0A4C1XJC7_EUMVA|nr:hypothetical protein EVAR_47262_1 [Eumeta japonica]
MLTQCGWEAASSHSHHQRSDSVRNRRLRPGSFLATALDLPVADVKGVQHAPVPIPRRFPTRTLPRSNSIRGNFLTKRERHPSARPPPERLFLIATSSPPAPVRYPSKSTPRTPAPARRAH